MKVQGRRKRGRPKGRWLDRGRDDIKERDCSRGKCTTVLHGGVCLRISTPHKSWNKTKRTSVSNMKDCSFTSPANVLMSFFDGT